MAADGFRLIIHQSIPEGELPTFTKSAQTLTTMAETTEPDTLCYEWYVSEDGTDCYLVETYTTSDAFLLHLSHLMEALKTMPGPGPISEALVFGSPSAKVREALAGMGPKFFPLLVGCTR